MTVRHGGFFTIIQPAYNHYSMVISTHKQLMTIIYQLTCMMAITQHQLAELLLALVVGRDGHIHIVQGAVSVAQCDDLTTWCVADQR